MPRKEDGSDTAVVRDWRLAEKEEDAVVVTNATPKASKRGLGFGIRRDEFLRLCPMVVYRDWPLYSSVQSILRLTHTHTFTSPRGSIHIRLFSQPGFVMPCPPFLFHGPSIADYHEKERFFGP